MTQASRLEEELKNNFQDVNVNIVKSSGGTFKVTVDGVVIFDKLSMPLDLMGGNSFPKDNEITEKINALK